MITSKHLALLIKNLKTPDTTNEYLKNSDTINEYLKHLTLLMNTSKQLIMNTSKHVTLLTHWGRDKMAAVFQTTFSNAFSWMKMCEFRLRFHWNLFPMVQLTISQHWFRLWLGADQATSHDLNHCWLFYWRIYASLGLNELINTSNHPTPLMNTSKHLTLLMNTSKHLALMNTSKHLTLMNNEGHLTLIITERHLTLMNTSNIELNEGQIKTNHN